jgi:GNAT superfamily N-acetyltransferase
MVTWLAASAEAQIGISKGRMMSAKVIQGSFLGNQPELVSFIQAKPSPPSAPANPALPPRPAKAASRPPGPPTPAFSGGAQPSGPPRLPRRSAPPPGPPAPAFAGKVKAVQRHGAGSAFAVEAGPLGLASGGGRPLPEVVRGRMEAALGADFSNVRVHVGPQAERIGAIAFTIGSDIYFAPGRYQPDTLQGQQLLGHELAHVVQQRSGRVRNPLGAGLAVVQDHALEAEADRLGQHAVACRVPVQAKRRSGAALPATSVRISPPISAGPGRYRLTAGAGGRQVGSVMVHARNRSAIEVTDLGVDAAERGHGIGRLLVASAARTGLNLGRSTMTLAAQDNGNRRLTQWYRAMGFAQVGVNRHGFPQLEAPIGRVLAGVAQRKRGWGSSGTIQAMRVDSALEDLARPKVFKLPEKQVAAQDEIVRQLNANIAKKISSGEFAEEYALYGLGTIEVVDLRRKTGVLRDPEILPIQWRALGTLEYRRGYDLIKNDRQLSSAIVENVLETLDQAGQIAYLENLNLSRDDWVILIEVHYYYRRSQEAIVFHKDTIGDTVFVNLNFLNTQEILGPEYILNPSAELEKEHTSYIGRNLPDAFMRDLGSQRQTLSGPTKIKATKIPPKHVVSFVDELIYHATPLPRRRTLRGGQLGELAKDKYFLWYTEASNLRAELQTSKRDTEFDIDEALVMGQKLGLSKDAVESAFAESDKRKKASIPGGKDARGYSLTGVNPAVKPRLKRQVSSWSVKKNLPAPLPEGTRRQFFRTWVRLIKRANIGDAWNRDFNLERDLQRTAMSPEGTYEDYMRYRQYLEREAEF